MTTLRRTPLHAAHQRLGARLVDFAGFEMPVQYDSILAEHAAVREAAGVFDVSHMGQLELEGPDAIAATGRLLSRPVADLAVGRVRYALLCNDAGGVVDDVTVYRTGEAALFLCVNASNIEKDEAWIRDHVAGDVVVRNPSADTGLIALQGPKSLELLVRLGAEKAAELKRFRYDRLEVAGVRVGISRTGYTGADGFELYCAAGAAEALFESLLREGEPLGVKPAGLGARDTLRLEAALPLYGHELDDETSPLEAGLHRFVDLEHDFIGAKAIRERREAGATKALAGFVLEDRGIAREGYAVVHAGAEIGRVTSGAPSPTLGISIGLAYVPPALAAVGSTWSVRVRSRDLAARVVETPFVGGAQAGRRKSSPSA
jgi:aminomethyltransferase